MVCFPGRDADARPATDRVADVLPTDADARSSRSVASAREEWIDSAKGLCILSIVVCHTMRGLVSAGIMPPDTGWQFWDDFFYKFQVPVFFFVAGLFAEQSYNKSGFGSFLKTKFQSLAYPYVVWQTLEILTMLAFGGANNHTVTAARLLEFPYLPFMQLWFLYVLLMVMGTYALLRCGLLSNGEILAISIGILFLPRISWIPFNQLCQNLIYFSLGLVLRGRIGVLRSARPLLLLLSALTLGVLLAAIVRMPVDLGRPFRAVPAILGGTATVLVSFAFERWRWWQVVCAIGRRSLEIYVAHTVFAAGMRTVLLKILHVDNLALHISLGIAASIAGPMLLVSAAQMLPGFRIPLFKPGFAVAKVKKRIATVADAGTSACVGPQP